MTQTRAMTFTIVNSGRAYSILTVVAVNGFDFESTFSVSMNIGKTVHD